MAGKKQEGLDPKTVIELRMIKYVSIEKAKEIRESAIKKGWIVKFYKNTVSI